MARRAIITFQDLLATNIWDHHVQLKVGKLGEEGGGGKGEILRGHYHIIHTNKIFPNSREKTIIYQLEAQLPCLKWLLQFFRPFSKMTIAMLGKIFDRAQLRVLKF